MSTRLKLGAVACLAVGLALFQNVVQSQEPPAPVTNGGKSDVAIRASRLQSQILQVQDGKDKFHVWRCEFKSPNDCAAAAARAKELGVFTVSRFSKYWLVLTKPDYDATDKMLSDLQKNGLVWWEFESNIETPPPPTIVYDPNAPQLRASEPIVRGGIDVGGKRYTGKGVIIAVIDTGCDFRNDDFIVEGPHGKTSRFLYLWDTLSEEYDQHKRGSAPMIDFKYPNGSNVGTLYTNEQLNQELRSGAKTIPEPDENGHGTSCAGIAAGNGRCIPVRDQVYGKYAGVAPEADLIGIRIGKGQSLGNSYLLGLICEFLQKVAGDRPLVITCSFGGQVGGRDGFRIKERELAARFPLDIKRQAICIAAGNEREDGLHARVSLSPGETRELSWLRDPEFPSREKSATRNKASAASLELYVDGLANPDKDLSFAGPSKSEYRRNRLSNSDVYEYYSSSPDGSGKLTNRSADAIVVDAYLYTHVAKPKEEVGRVRFSPNSVSMQYLTGTPSSAETAICVGSYDFNNEFDFNHRQINIPIKPYGAGTQGLPMRVGERSAYSNPGPLRKGGNKPDLVAPGQFHIAPAVKAQKDLFAAYRLSVIVDNLYPLMIDTSGNYKLSDGTSAATPYAAGVVALMFEKNKNLTLGQVRQLLHDKATRNGAGWNMEYGYGKLNFEAVTAIMNAIP